MSISYDPDKVPELDLDATADALAAGLIPIQVICDEKGAKVGDPSGVSFVAYVNFVPRIGERIVLQDGTACEVTMIFYKIVIAPGSQYVTMFPNVRAVAIRKTP